MNPGPATPAVPAPADFFGRWRTLPARWTEEGLEVGGAPVTFAWERPLMEAFARELARPETELLEVGFGMGIFAGCARARGVRAHTIVEPHPEILAVADRWRSAAPDGVRLVRGYWQDVAERLGRYDAVFYDSFSPPETLEDDLFRFFRLAAERLLRPGGRLGFWVPGDVLPPAWQRELARWFDRVALVPVAGLEPTPEARRLGFGPTMLAPIAYR